MSTHVYRPPEHGPDGSWEESVRLDLRYVENWTIALDAQILVRTVHAVVRGDGAY